MQCFIRGLAEYNNSAVTRFLFINIVYAHIVFRKQPIWTQMLIFRFRSNVVKLKNYS